MKIFRLFLLLLASAAVTISQGKAQTTATGTVYLDGNENGRFDESERGIPQVAVSNGREVVLTDEQGAYTLEIDERDAKIFVIKPADYSLPVDELNRPKFYYLHKPEGSPQLDYAGVEPTGPLPERINFGLLPGSSDRSFKVLLFGDPQPYTRQEVDYFDRDVVSELHDANQYAFGITLGDIVGDDLELYDPYNQSIAKIGVPWFNVTGNHDMNLDAESDRYADETYERVYGPATYSFNYGDAHFIMVDDIVYPRTDGESGYIGGFTEEQLTFFEQDLKQVPKDKLVVLAFHIPTFISGKWGRTFRTEDRQRLFELLKNYSHTLTLSAHTHMQQFHFFAEDEGWQRVTPHIEYNVGTTCGDWWSGSPDERGIPPTTMRDGTPNGYATLNIEGNSFTVDYKVADKPADYRMSIWGPKVVPQNSWHSAQLYVNYFLGSKYTDIDYRIKGGEMDWLNMARVQEQDPFIATLREKWDQSATLPAGKRPSNPEESSHLWKAGVPNDLPLGKQTIEIRVSDMFGRVFLDEFSYEVVEPKGAE